MASLWSSEARLFLSSGDGAVFLAIIRMKKLQNELEIGKTDKIENAI